jgi:N-acetylglucosaminyldiphosphoundecaprenol N-acetyl-beta-D-mannosaminyltransferase
MTSLANPSRLTIGRIEVDRVTFDGALDAIAALVDGRRGGVVLTPNVDHIVLAGEDERFQGAYRECDLSLADGMPVVWLASAMGEPVPEKISGSDLVDPLMARAAARGWRVFLLGGAEGVADRAAANLVSTYPALNIVGTSSPRIAAADPRARTNRASGDPPRHDRRHGEQERHALVESIRATNPDVVLVGLGAPKQELWIHEAARALAPAVLLGVGASIDFLAGTARRAPPWMSRMGVEWTYRLAQEPRRMWRRYLVRDPKLIGIVLGDWLTRSHRRASMTIPPR